MAGVKSTLRKKKKSERSNSVLNSSMPSSLSPTTFRWLSRGVAFALALCVLILLGVSSNAWVAFPHSSQKIQSPQIYTIDVVNEFHHDHKAFTQGLLYWKNDTLYESIGLYGESAVRRVALRTGKVEAQYKMDDSSFGEGLTLLDERLYQVTWLRNIGYIYDRSNLSKLATFTHQMNDGWGLATDGKILFGSDGSSTLYRFDPQTMKEIQKQTITYKGLEVHNLNELEFVNGEVWANVWQTDCIARISPGDGTVVGWILLSNLREGLIAGGAKGIDVLNGIAWDSKKQRIFVTGKLWPKLYEIKLKPVEKKSNVNVEQLCIRMPFRF
ncbi:glutaminyl-peptide cyclotransferase [Beta vulgaris subsp. vulgaris]|uniref:glutaminyl-peptide cyclotransferase n=1 Tax=Beta vulgaris subsp. vulgaris TaxID=3555 RepID=UPI002037090C|nr:glutaminyl-peptide cyclotransferase [Beta vulgaris subsp. vulgaris]